MAWRFLMVYLIVFTGCSYRWMSRQDGGPVQELKLGAFRNDGNPKAYELNIRTWVSRCLRARGRPRLSINASHTLGGTVVTKLPVGSGFDGQGAMSVERVDIHVQLYLETAKGIVWRGPVTRVTGSYSRGLRAIDTERAKYGAIRTATEQALDTAMNLFFMEPPLTQGHPI